MNQRLQVDGEGLAVASENLQDGFAFKRAGSDGAVAVRNGFVDVHRIEDVEMRFRVVAQNHILLSLE